MGEGPGKGVLWAVSQNALPCFHIRLAQLEKAPGTT